MARRTLSLSLSRVLFLYLSRVEPFIIICSVGGAGKDGSQSFRLRTAGGTLSENRCQMRGDFLDSKAKLASCESEKVLSLLDPAR